MTCCIVSLVSSFSALLKDKMKFFILIFVIFVVISVNCATLEEEFSNFKVNLHSSRP